MRPEPGRLPSGLLPERDRALVRASEGELTLVGCNRLEADIPTTGADVWGSGKVPFVDPFDVEFPDPVTGVFERMPRP